MNVKSNEFKMHLSLNNEKSDKWESLEIKRDTLIRSPFGITTPLIIALRKIGDNLHDSNSHQDRCQSQIQIGIEILDYLFKPLEIIDFEGYERELIKVSIGDTERGIAISLIKKLLKDVNKKNLDIIVFLWQKLNLGTEELERHKKMTLNERRKLFDNLSGGNVKSLSYFASRYENIRLINSKIEGIRTPSLFTIATEVVDVYHDSPVKKGLPVTSSTDSIDRYIEPFL